MKDAEGSGFWSCVVIEPVGVEGHPMSSSSRLKESSLSIRLSFAQPGLDRFGGGAAG